MLNELGLAGSGVEAQPSTSLVATGGDMGQLYLITIIILDGLTDNPQNLWTYEIQQQESFTIIKSQSQEIKEWTI